MPGPEEDTQTLLENGALRSLSTEYMFQYVKHLRGRVVVITGCASGLGRGFAIEAARRGAKVVAADINAKGLDQTLAIIAKAQGDAVGQRCDVTSWKDQLALFALAQSTYGRVDVVVANAGISDAHIPQFTTASEVASIEELKEPNLSTIDVNLKGVVYTTRIGLHYLRRNPTTEPKRIILVASYASFYGVGGLLPIYTMSKHAILGLGRALKYLTAADGISCVTVHPTFVDTPLNDPMRPYMDMDNLASVEDFCGALVYASTASSNEVPPGAMLLVHPKGVAASTPIPDMLEVRPGPFEMPRL